MSDQQFLDWEDGENVAYLTGIKATRANDKDRASISLRFSSAASYDAPFTNLNVTLPRASDDTPTKIMLDRKVKLLLWPLAEVPVDATSGVKIAEIFNKIKANLELAFFKCELTMKGKDGKQIDNRTGELRRFYEPVEFKVTEAIEKAAYVSAMDYDMDDIPF